MTVLPSARDADPSQAQEILHRHWPGPLPGQKFPFTPHLLLQRSLSLRGILQGSCLPNTFLPRLVELNRQGRFPYERLIKTYDFTDINKAFEESKVGRAIKPVLMMSRS